jgi:hypothetical protein
MPLLGPPSQTPGLPEVPLLAPQPSGPASAVQLTTGLVWCLPASHVGRPWVWLGPLPSHLLQQPAQGSIHGFNLGLWAAMSWGRGPLSRNAAVTHLILSGLDCRLGGSSLQAI